MQQKQNILGFTLVELIVVITIVGILSTVGFVSYSGYLTGARDSNRISQLTKLSDSLQVYSASKTLPLPDNKIDITASGSLIAYQGEVGVDVLETIDYTNGGKDPKDDSYYTYYLTKDRTSLQLMAMMEEQQSTAFNFTTNTNAINYEDRYPKVYGRKLGVLTYNDDTNTDLINTPANQVAANAAGLDIVLTDTSFTAHISDIISDKITGTGSNIRVAGSKASCKRIKQTGGARGNGVYNISPIGEELEVYCDMETAGGGWTFGVYVASNVSNTDVFFNTDMGVYDTNREPSGSTYSIDISNLNHTEMLILYDTSNISEAEATNNMLRLKYNIFTPGVYMGPLDLPNGGAFFGGGDGLYFSTSFGEPGIYTTRSRFGAAGWGIGTTGDVIPYLIRISANPSGVYKYPEVWGDTISNSVGHEAYIYVK